MSVMTGTCTLELKTCAVRCMNRIQPFLSCQQFLWRIAARQRLFLIGIMGSGDKEKKARLKQNCFVGVVTGGTVHGDAIVGARRQVFCRKNNSDALAYADVERCISVVAEDCKERVGQKRRVVVPRSEPHDVSARRDATW